MDRGLAATTINQTRAVLRAIFAGADLTDDPSVAFDRAKTRRATSGAITFYRPDEVGQLVEHAADDQDAALYLTAAFTGLRASELRALRWRSVDFGDSVVHVERCEFWMPIGDQAAWDASQKADIASKLKGR